MTSIKTAVEELCSINTEIKRMSVSIKKLKLEKKAVEKKVEAYLSEHNLPGVKYNGNVICLKLQEKPILKPKKERVQDMENFLKSHGVVANADLFLKQMKSVGKQPIATTSIKLEHTE